MSKKEAKQHHKIQNLNKKKNPNTTLYGDITNTNRKVIPPRIETIKRREMLTSALGALFKHFK